MGKTKLGRTQERQGSASQEIGGRLVEVQTRAARLAAALQREFEALPPDLRKPPGLIAELAGLAVYADDATAARLVGHLLVAAMRRLPSTPVYAARPPSGRSDDPLDWPRLYVDADRATRAESGPDARLCVMTWARAKAIAGSTSVGAFCRGHALHPSTFEERRRRGLRQIAAALAREE